MFQIIISLVILLLGRIMYVIAVINQGRTQEVKRRRSKPAKTAVILGSGGHTAEMIRLLEKLNFVNYNPRLYIMADSDKSSEIKVDDLEKRASKACKGDFKKYRIPRSRSVNQPYSSSVLSTLHSVLYSLPVLLREKPDLILCNGPGTCVPICAIAFIMKVMWICDSKIVYIESICRVKTLSLTGKILLHFVDEFFVQWEDLHQQYRKTKYIGTLV